MDSSESTIIDDDSESARDIHTFEQGLKILLGGQKRIESELAHLRRETNVTRAAVSHVLNQLLNSSCAESREPSHDVPPTSPDCIGTQLAAAASAGDDGSRPSPPSGTRKIDQKLVFEVARDDPPESQDSSQTHDSVWPSTLLFAEAATDCPDQGIWPGSLVRRQVLFEDVKVNSNSSRVSELETRITRKLSDNGFLRQSGPTQLEVASHLPKLPLLMLQPSSNMRTLVDLIGMCVLAYDMLTTPLILAWDLEVFAMCEVILSTLFPNWTELAIPI